MKHLTGLQEPILNLFGEPYSEQKPTAVACTACGQRIVETRVITIGQIMAACLQNQPSAPLDAIPAMKIALAIFDAAEVDLEDADFKRVKGAFEAGGFSAFIVAAGVALLNAAEDAAAVAATMAAMEKGGAPSKSRSR